MSKADHYTQVTMHAPAAAAAGGRRVHVAFVPSKLAVVGKRLRIDSVPGDWTVVERGQTLPADQVEAKSRDYLHQREASDV